MHKAAVGVSNNLGEPRIVRLEALVGAFPLPALLLPLQLAAIRSTPS